MQHTKIKTFESACKALKISATALPDVSMLPEDQQQALVAHYKLIIIAKALNDGWQPNWNDQNEYKYFPWFKVVKTKSGSGLSYDDCGGWYSFTCVGSRLCFKSREVAEYAGKTFLKFYEEYFLIK